MSDELSLGSCCECEGTKNVRNIIMADFKAPISGRGWGCFQCGTPADGAVYVLCDECLEKFDGKEANPKFACRGYPGEDGRIEFDKLTEPFAHDESKHPELDEKVEYDIYDVDWDDDEDVF